MSAVCDHPAIAAGRAAKPWLLRRTIAVAALVVAGVESALLFAGNNVLGGELLDPDCYMHLVRALRLMRGAWLPEGFEPRLNAPFGFALHWTGLFDGLLAAAAWPLTLFGFAPRDALYIGGAFVSPLLLVGALALLAAATRRWLPGPYFILLAVLLFTQPQLSGAFLAGRTDHHSLIIGLMLAQMAWIYAMAAGTGRPCVLGLLAGVAAGIELCTTIEALPVITMVSLVLAAAWVWLRRDPKPLLFYWLAAFATVAVWVAWMRGSAMLTPYYDRVSIVHVAVLACGVLGLCLAIWLSRRMPSWIALGIGGGASLLLVAAVYPRFYLGPWPDLEPAVRAWHREVLELQPLLPDTLGNFVAFLSQFTAVLLALPLTVARLRRGDEADRLAMLVSLCGFLLFGGLALAQMRWSAEVQAVMLLPWTLTVLAIMRSEIGFRLGRHWLPMRTPLVMAALLAQLCPMFLLPAQGWRVPVSAQACDWTAAARGLAALPDQRGIVMTSLYAGPEILWRTGFGVVGAPYEIAPAHADTRRFEQGDPVERREILARRHISYVLSCGPERDASRLGLRPAAFAVPGFRLYRPAPAG